MDQFTMKILQGNLLIAKTIQLHSLKLDALEITIKKFHPETYAEYQMLFEKLRHEHKEELEEFDKSLANLRPKEEADS